MRRLSGRRSGPLAVADDADGDTFDYGGTLEATLAEIERIEPRTRNDAHRLIEEAMLAANECAAGFIESAEHPALFRVHEGPTPERRVTLQNYLKALGLGLAVSDDPKPRLRKFITPREFRLLRFNERKAALKAGAALPPRRSSLARRKESIEPASVGRDSPTRVHFL